MTGQIYNHLDQLYLDVSHEMDENILIDYYWIDIIVNGRRLIDLVREIELPFAEAEGHPELAGDYQNISAKAVFLPSRYLLPESGKQDTTFLACGFCGDWGCWPLEGRITVEDDRVIWSDFYQPHRTRDNPVIWCYDRLGPFVFDRRQYKAEIGKMLADETYQEAQRRWDEWLEDQARQSGWVVYVPEGPDEDY